MMIGRRALLQTPTYLRAVSIQSRNMSENRFPPLTTPMLPEGCFKGKVAFVTGGGTGLGRGMTTMLSRLGADVAIASRRLPLLENAAKEIMEETGGKVGTCTIIS